MARRRNENYYYNDGNALHDWIGRLGITQTIVADLSPLRLVATRIVVEDNRKPPSTGALMYSMQGAKSDFDEYNGTLKLDYINIPILANVYVVKGLALKAGIQPGFCINKKVSVGGISVDIDEAFKQADTNYKINTVDFSIPIGLSYEYNGLVIDARYNLGVTKVADGYIENEGIKMRSDDRHSVFQFTLGYKFQL